MPYKYKVKIQARGAKGGDGSTSNDTKGPGGNGAAVTAEYEVLTGNSEGVQTDSTGNLVWNIKYRLLEGGAGGTVNNTNKYGGRGGDGVEVKTASNIIVIAGGGGGGAGDDIHTGYRGGHANGSGTTDGNYSKVDGGNGNGETPQNDGDGGYDGIGGGGGYGGGGQNYISGSAGSSYDSGGKGGAGASDGSNYDGRAGGGGGGGGWGGGGGGVAGIGIASGGGAGASRIWNNTSDASVGFKRLDSISITAATSVHAFINFISYKSSDNGTTWEEYWNGTNGFPSINYSTFTDFNIPLNNVPDFNAIPPTSTSVDILSDQSYTWDLTLKSGTEDGDEQYSIFTSGTYSAFTDAITNPSANITTGGVTRGTVEYNISTRKLIFTGSGLEHDNVTSSFQVFVKDSNTPSGSYGNGSTSLSVTQHKRLYKHESSKTFTPSPPIANTGLITTNDRAIGVDIATLFQPKSFLNFEHTSTIGGKFFSSSSDLSGVFGEYKSDYSGNDIISTDTGFQIGGIDIRYIYAKRQPSLDIFDTSPGRKNYRFTLTEDTTALLICVGGGGAGNHGEHGGQGGHGGKIIVQELTMTAGNYDLSFNVGAGQDAVASNNISTTRRGGDSSIIGGSLNSNTAVANQLTDYVNDNIGGGQGNDAQNGGFQLEYPDGTIHNIGGGGGGGKKNNNSAGNGYYGGQDGYINNTPSTRAGIGGGGGGGFQEEYVFITNKTTMGGSGGHGLCAILFKP